MALCGEQRPELEIVQRLAAQQLLCLSDALSIDPSIAFKARFGAMRSSRLRIGVVGIAPCPERRATQRPLSAGKLHNLGRPRPRMLSLHAVARVRIIGKVLVIAKVIPVNQPKLPIEYPGWRLAHQARLPDDPFTR